MQDRIPKLSESLRDAVTYEAIAFTLCFLEYQCLHWAAREADTISEEIATRQAKLLLQTYDSEEENSRLKSEITALKERKAATQAALEEAKRESASLKDRIIKYLALPCGSTTKRRWSFKSFLRSVFHCPTLEEMRAVDEEWMISTEVDGSV
ncbi:hypothetical protein BSKO_09785 [Bryopsis sp. KO-2023]|nr:hypothetical protein BSKO_09785 [Bryopsis sp. KO-2023]